MAVAHHTVLCSCDSACVLCYAQGWYTYIICSFFFCLRLRCVSGVCCGNGKRRQTSKQSGSNENICICACACTQGQWRLRSERRSSHCERSGQRSERGKLVCACVCVFAGPLLLVWVSSFVSQLCRCRSERDQCLLCAVRAPVLCSLMRAALRFLYSSLLLSLCFPINKQQHQQPKTIPAHPVALFLCSRFLFLSSSQQVNHTRLSPPPPPRLRRRALEPAAPL